MRDRPYTLLSCSVSIDGYIGNALSRLLLSNDADFDRVDEVRAGCDAILVGAATIRQDDPRLLVRSAERRAARIGRESKQACQDRIRKPLAPLTKDARADWRQQNQAEPCRTRIETVASPCPR